MKVIIIGFMIMFVMSGCVQKVYATSSKAYEVSKIIKGD